jgi:hypothetical protein
VVVNNTNNKHLFIVILSLLSHPPPTHPLPDRLPDRLPPHSPSHPRNPTHYHMHFLPPLALARFSPTRCLFTPTPIANGGADPGDDGIGNIDQEDGKELAFACRLHLLLIRPLSAPYLPPTHPNPPSYNPRTSSSTISHHTLTSIYRRNKTGIDCAQLPLIKILSPTLINFILIQE